MPAIQLLQVAALVAPSCMENVPCGHAKHAVILVAPIVVEYVPFGHNKHWFTLDAAMVLEYVPCGHNWQTDAEVAPT